MHVETAGCLLSRCAWSAGAQGALVVHWVVYPPSDVKKFVTDMEDYHDLLDGHGRSCWRITRLLNALR